MDEQRSRALRDVAHEATLSTVADLLAKGRTRAGAAEVAQSAGRFLDRLFVRLDREHPPACRAGCSWCCYVRVACSVPEAITVADYVQSGVPKRTRRQLTARLEAVCDQTRDLDASARSRLQLPCPFLDEGKCVVHAARPLACRGWHSFDVEQCKRHWKDQTILVDASGERLSLRSIVSRALREGVQRAGLVGDRVALDAAVLLSLRRPEAVEAWLRGEDGFAEARWRG